jgi:hypothetical protein
VRAEDQVRPRGPSRPLAEHVPLLVHAHVRQAGGAESIRVRLCARRFLEGRRRDFAEANLLVDGGRLSASRGVESGAHRRVLHQRLNVG